MAETKQPKMWNLLEAAAGTAAAPAPFGLSARDFGESAAGLAVRRWRMSGGLSEGVDVVEVDNGRLKFHVLPTRGMGIWKAWLGALEIGWKSPVRGPVHPHYVPLAEPSGLGWLDGFDELICRCGLESNGAPDFDERGVLRYGLHGRIANRPAHALELSYDASAKRIALTGTVDETRFHFSKLRLRSTVSTDVDSPTLRIVDEVTNLSANPAEVQLLYHCNFGQPLLDPGARVVAAAEKIAPRDAGAAAAAGGWDVYGSEQPGSGEQVYFLDLAADAAGQCQVLLKNAHATAGVTLQFTKQQLPHFIVWKNTPGAADGYVTGLEPATNLPNARTFEGEQGRVVKLAAGASARFELALTVHDDAAAIREAEAAIEQQRAKTKAQVLSAPQRGWSPGA